MLPAVMAIMMIVSILSACASGGSETSDTTAAATTAETAPQETTRKPHKVPVDSLDFEGGEYRIMIFEWQGYTYYFFADELNGDVMNDALYDRQRIIEETLNVKMKKHIFDNKTTSAVPNAVKTTVLAGEDAYDCALFHCIGGIADTASNGYLYNLDMLPYIDITAEWWNQKQMNVLRLGKNTYYAVNDYMIPCPYMIYFNRGIAENYGLDDPYEKTFEGSWLLDDFTGMCRAVSKDLDGSGTYTMDDQYGVTANEVSKYISFVTGSNQFMTSRDSEGRVELAMNTEKMVNLVEVFAALMNENCVWQKSGEVLTLECDRVLFELSSIAAAERMREYDIDLGFLPYPKYDEKQEEYISLDWGGLMGVPVSISRPELVGAVMELMAYEAKNDVIPTYYGTVLSGKLARDENAGRVLDILFDTIVYEIGGNYFGFSPGFTDLFYTLGRLSIQGKSTDFASWYAKNEPTAKTTIANFYKNLDSVELQS